MIINILALILIIIVCNIIYVLMIFMLKVVTINDLKGYLNKNESK